MAMGKYVYINVLSVLLRILYNLILSMLKIQNYEALDFNEFYIDNVINCLIILKQRTLQ